MCLQGRAWGEGIADGKLAMPGYDSSLQFFEEKLKMSILDVYFFMILPILTFTLLALLGLSCVVAPFVTPVR